MGPTGNLEEQLSALEEGRAFSELSGFRIFEVRGSDAEAWLGDLVTAGVVGLEEGDSRPSLLLDPTGHIRAVFEVIRASGGFVLLQDPEQPDPVGRLLDRYVLSSDVTLTDVSGEQAAFALPAQVEVPRSLWRSRHLAAVPRSERKALSLSLIDSGLVAAGLDSREALRIRSGLPRFPVDLGATSIPAEASWDRTMVDREKGCFLGQESIARVANLGHPPTVVVGLFAAHTTLRRGDPVFVAGERRGEVTSAFETSEGTYLIARLPSPSNGPHVFETSEGVALDPTNGEVRGPI